MYTYLIIFEIALVTMQKIYEKLAANPKSYLLYQVGLFGQNGISWAIRNLNAVGLALK
jgi:hypothetical protein